VGGGGGGGLSGQPAHQADGGAIDAGERRARGLNFARDADVNGAVGCNGPLLCWIGFDKRLLSYSRNGQKAALKRARPMEIGKQRRAENGRDARKQGHLDP
jgi:hypothetical protein